MIDYDALTKNEIYASVLGETIAILSQLAPTVSYSTNELVAQLYPKNKAIFAKQEYTRGIVYRAIAWYAQRDLKAYVSKGSGEEGKRKFKGKTVYPLQWHAAKALMKCVHCGSEYFE